MSKCFVQIFWGLLFVIVDIEINHIDLVPDFVGYILVALGCRGLVSASRHFSTANTMSWVLFGLSFVGYVVRGEFARLYTLVHLAVDCALMWFLLGGVMELAVARQRPDIFEQASKRRLAYVVLLCGARLLGFVVHGSREATFFMAFIWVVCTLVVLILILQLIYRARIELSDGGQ